MRGLKQIGEQNRSMRNTELLKKRAKRQQNRGKQKGSANEAENRAAKAVQKSEPDRLERSTQESPEDRCREVHDNQDQNKGDRTCKRKRINIAAQVFGKRRRVPGSDDDAQQQTRKRE